MNSVKLKLQRVFNKDQVEALGKRARGTQWRAETVKKAVQLRYACGARGYEFLRQASHPVPAYRTLCQRVQHVDMNPGIDNCLLDMLATKLSVYSNSDRDCSMLIDEVQIKERLEYDKGLKRIMGSVSEDIYGHSSNLASHALCFMVRGVRTNWKQMVAWYATGPSTPGVKQWQVAEKLIELLYERGITVRAIVSDMGPNNQSMWKHVGIYSRRDLVVNSIQHPVSSAQQLYFLADVPHLLKNLRNMLLTHYLVLPDTIMQRHSLPVAKVCFMHIKIKSNIA